MRLQRSTRNYMDAEQRARLAAEAEARIADFLQTHDVQFNGAGEENLPSVSQAWDIHHLDKSQQDANKATLRGIADILRDYRTIRCEVHGETGAAHSAPKQLARYLQLHPEFDVRSCMEALARARAQACVDALISMGVPPKQLFLTFTGMGGRIAVDFRPEGKVRRLKEYSNYSFANRIILPLISVSCARTARLRVAGLSDSLRTRSLRRPARRTQPVRRGLREEAALARPSHYDAAMGPCPLAGTPWPLRAQPHCALGGARPQARAAQVSKAGRSKRAAHVAAGGLPPRLWQIRL